MKNKKPIHEAIKIEDVPFDAFIITHLVEDPLSHIPCKELLCSFRQEERKTLTTTRKNQDYNLKENRCWRKLGNEKLIAIDNNDHNKLYSV